MRKSRPELQRPVLVVDDQPAVADALVRGAGAGVLPAFLGEPARRRGELVRLDDEALTTMQVHAVYSAAQRDDPRLRVLIAATEREVEATLGAGGG